jgi:hypothetical protein
VNERGTSLYAQIASATTVSGRQIFVRATDRQNHYRRHLSELSWQVVSSLDRHGLSETMFADTIEKLRTAKGDPTHYGDNSPGSFFDDAARTAIVPDPRFSYWNLYEYGVVGEEGFEGFKRDCGISPSIDHPTLCGLIVLLLIDSAVELLDHGDAFLAASDGMEAALCVEQMFHDRGYRDMLQEARRDLARKGGAAAHRETDEYKAQVVAKWRSGEFPTKAAAARWAMRQFPLRSTEVIARWLRDADKE